MEKYYIIIPVLIIILIFAILFIFLIEMRIPLLFKYKPKLIRNNSIKLLKKKNQDIYILGTFNNLHFSLKDYNYLHIKSVIKKLNPDLILIESRNEELEKDNLCDGPMEMLYANLTAKSINIPVKGIDYWEDHNLEANEIKRIQIVSKKIIDEVKEHQKVLVIIGYKSMNKVINKLNFKGYKKGKLSSIKKDELFYVEEEKLVYPKGMTYYVDKRLQKEYMNERRYFTDQRLSNITRGIINYLTQFRGLILEEEQEEKINV